MSRPDTGERGPANPSWRAPFSAATVLACLVAAQLGCGGGSLQPTSGRGGSSTTGGLGATGGPGGAGGTAGDGAPAGGASGGDVSTGGGAAGGAAGSSAVVTDVSTLATLCDPSTVNPGRSPLRRLSGFEYDNTVRDLVGITTSPSLNVPYSATFPLQGGAFSNDADGQTVSDVLVEAYRRAAEEIAAASIPRLAALAPACNPAETGSAACATSFIRAFGKKAFRRPLTSEEVASYQDLFTDGSSAGSYEGGIAEVIAGMLQSRHFLYRVERGLPTANPQVLSLTSYELATRLAYFVWSSMPDQALFAAADDNQLATVNQLRAQVARMLDDPRAHAMVARFHREWLRLDDVLQVTKSTALYPEWNPALAADLVTESETFVDNVFWSDGGLATLLTAPYSYMNGNVAKHYGLTVPPESAATFMRVNLAPTQRAGILTQGAFLAGQNRSSLTSPTQRGLFVRSRLLCSAVPPPPPGVSFTPPDLPPGLTTRQRIEAATADAPCAACHRQFDPLGFAFENFDTFGRWRATDGNLPIDASGEIVAAKDPRTNGPFNGAVELMQRLATSGDVRACVAAQWFRWSSGRVETLPDDACSLLAINKQFEAANYDMRALLPAIVTTDAFRFRKAGGTP